MIKIPKIHIEPQNYAKKRQKMDIWRFFANIPKNEKIKNFHIVE